MADINISVGAKLEGEIASRIRQATDVLKRAPHALVFKREDGAFDLTWTEDSGLLSKSIIVKSIDEHARTVDFVASTDEVDRHDEIIDQSTWETAEYRSNPVCLWSHEAWELPIGQCVDLAIRKGPRGQQLECKIEFATAELNPKADQVFKMLQRKFLRAVSVGFKPKSARWEMRDGNEILVWSQCVLREISVVNIPANGSALAKMKSALSTVRLERRPKALLEHAEDNTPATPGSSGEQPGGATASPVTEKTMTEAEKALAAAQEKLDKSAVTIAELRLEAKTANDARAKAEACAKDLEAKVAALETAKAAHEAQSAKLVEERDAAKARAEKAESSVIAAEVDALVGKKIKPTEKDLFVNLKKSDPDLFTKMVAERDDMTVLDTVIAGNGEDASQGAPVAPNAKAASDEMAAEAARLGGLSTH